LQNGFISQSNIAANPFSQFFTASSAINSNNGNLGSFLINPQTNPRSFENLSLSRQTMQNLSNSYSASNRLNSLSNNRKFNQFYLGQDFFKNKSGKSLVSASLVYQNSFDNQSRFNSFSGQKQNQLFDIALGFKPKAGSLFIISAGQLEEYANNMLNSKSLGAFATGNNPKTNYFKIASAYNLPYHLNLTAAISEGKTNINGNNNGVFRDFSTLKSRSSSISLSYNNPKNSLVKGSIGIGYSEPMRIYKGSANYDIPVAIDSNFNLIRKTGTISLSPKGQEKDYEIFYNRQLTETSQSNSFIKLNFIVQTQPSNIQSAKNNLVGMMSYGKRW